MKRAFVSVAVSPTGDAVLVFAGRVTPMGALRIGVSRRHKKQFQPLALVTPYHPLLRGTPFRCERAFYPWF